MSLLTFFCSLKTKETGSLVCVCGCLLGFVRWRVRVVVGVNEDGMRVIALQRESARERERECFMRERD